MINSKSAQSGATLIEVLIAIVVLSIGLLGLAGLQVTSIQSNYSAYYRSQATVLAYDYADRMRTNREVAKTMSSDSSFPASSSTHSVSGSQFTKDKAQWLNALALTLPDGTGLVERNGTQITISVRWNDNRGRIKPASDTSVPSETFIYRTDI